MAQTIPDVPVRTRASGFLDLPVELRYSIYEYLLCAFPPPSYRILDIDDLTLVDKTQLHPSILYVNHQIHDEARAVLIKNNLFVRLDTNLSEQTFLKFLGMLTSRGIPVLEADSEKGSKRYSTHCGETLLAMKYTITDTRAQKSAMERMRLLMLHRDFNDLCLHVGNGEASWIVDFAQKMRHDIVIYADTGDAHREWLSSRMAQERLLKPFSDNFRDVKDFHIATTSTSPATSNSKLHQEIVSRVLKSVNTPIPDTEAGQLAHLNDLKSRGNVAYAAKDTRMAHEYWSRACIHITQLRRKPWFTAKHLNAQPLTSPDRAFVAKLAEMVFLLNLNLAQVAILNIQTALEEGDPHFANGLANQSMISLHRASEKEAGLLLEPGIEEAQFEKDKIGDVRGGWRPTRVQMGKLWFRKARIFRLLWGWRMALATIEFAKMAVPGDMEVRREERRIREDMKQLGQKEDDGESFVVSGEGFMGQEPGDLGGLPPWAI